MKNLTLALTLIVTLSLFANTPAFAIDTPEILSVSFDAYKNEGFEKAFKIWMKGSPLENDKTSLLSMKGGFTQIETLYGKMIGYEIIRNYRIAKNVVRTYAVLFYEKGPLYLYVDCYRAAENWIIPEMQFHTKAQMILPEKLIHKD